MYLKVIVRDYLEEFNFNYSWLNLGNQPVEILIEDVYLLVVPSPQTSLDPEEDANRAQAAKAERLENAELLHIRGQAGRMLLVFKFSKMFNNSTEDSPQNQGLLDSLTAKIINNVQVTVKNIHIRYEDNISVPGVCRHLLALLGRIKFHFEYSTLLLQASLSLGSPPCQSTKTGHLRS
jgi:vacuolar protein sorting-associated protein 13A/C